MSNQPDDEGWLDPKAAEGQLLLVKEALEKPPTETPHFQAFLDMMGHIILGRDSTMRTGSLLDVGCGVGAYAALVNRFFPAIRYAGCDVSSHMIELAIQHFGMLGHFFVCDALGLDREGSPDIILASSLIEVCPNWRNVLRHLCSLQFKFLILNRVRLWNDPDHPSTERVYNTLYGTPSFEVVHNNHRWGTLRTIAQEAGATNTHTVVYQLEPETQLVCLLFEKNE